MALTHVYSGINEVKTYNFTGKIKDNVKMNWKNVIILKSGKKIDENYEVKNDDIIYIRKTPAGFSNYTPLDWGITILSGGLYIPFKYGYDLYKKQKDLDQLIKDNQKKQKSLNEQVDKLPFIKGAQNAAATGRSFPFAIGKSLMTPYRLCPAHYTIAGSKGETQYYNVVLEVGYNNILINKIKMGETVIKDFGSETTPQNGQYTFDSGVYYDSRNLIEIRQTGVFTETGFNDKIVLTELSEEIPHDHASGDADENARIEAEWQAGIVQELPSHAKSVEIIVLFDGLRKYDDGWKEQTVTLQPQWTNENNPNESDWHDFTNGFNQNGTYSNTFKYTTKEQMRYIARQDFTAAQAFNKNMKIRIKRTTPKAENSSQESVYLLAVQTTCYDAKKSTSSSLVTAQVLEPNERDKCCRIGLKIVANNNTSAQLDAISVIESGCARTWNGGEWSTAKTPTSNLAAWALEILTSPHHSPSQYSDDELDLASFGAWYEYCEQQGFKADGIITRSAKKKSILETLCKNSNAALVMSSVTGKMEVAIDNGRDYSVALLNSENIMSISTSKEFKRKTTGKKVTYINAAAEYDVDSVTFMKDGEDYDPASDTLTETTLEYVTSYEHAYKIAWREMAEETAQPRVVTVKAGLESAYYPIYSRVELQHKSLKIGIAHGVIKACIWYGGLLREIHLDGAVTFPATGACGVIINCVSDNGRGLLALKVSGSGTTSILQVETTVRSSSSVVPTAGNICSFGKLDNDGEFTLVTTSMLIINAEESDNGYTLTLVDYNPALYQYGKLPEYRSNLTSVPNGNKQTIESQREYVTTGESQADAAGAAQAAVDTVVKGTRFTNIYKIRPVENNIEDIIARMDEDARNASASMSILDDEIVLKVENTEKNLRAIIDITAGEIYQAVEDGDNETRGYIDTKADEILAQVDDMAKELTGLINVQAGAVTALVEGGGAAGEMSLSLNLPIMITAATRAQFVTASTEAKVAAVYALIENTTYYGIKGNASNDDVKALWDDAIAGGLLASQIILNADQIQLAGKTIFTSAKTNEVAGSAAAAAQSAAEATAAADATTKANAAQSAAEATAAADATAKRNDMAQKLGYNDYDAMVQAASNGQTIIDGGYLRTALIEVDNLLAQNIVLKQQGFIKSHNYAESDGSPTAGFMLDAANNVIKTYGMKAYNGDFRGNIEMSGGFLKANNTPFKPMAMINLGYNNDTILLTNSKNVSSITRQEKGVYTIYFTNPVKLATHVYAGNKYIDVFAIGNAADNFDAGFVNPIFMTPNWLRQYVDGRLVVDAAGNASVNYVVLYFIDNNYDQLQDPRSAQCFIFGTETD